MLVTVFAKDTRIDVNELQQQEAFRYVDMKKAPDLWHRARSQFSRQDIMNQKRFKILTEKNLAGYRRYT